MGLAAAGVALGVASAVEEALSGFDIGISTDGLWLTAAFVGGALSRRWLSAAITGAALLTLANVSYYAAGGAASGAGTWLLLGISGGAFFGAAGERYRYGPPFARLFAVLALAGVLITEGSEAFSSEGAPDDAVEFALGAILPFLLLHETSARIIGMVATTAFAVLSATDTVELRVP